MCVWGAPNRVNYAKCCSVSDGALSAEKGEMVQTVFPVPNKRPSSRDEEASTFFFRTHLDIWKEKILPAGGMGSRRASSPGSGSFFQKRTNFFAKKSKFFFFREEILFQGKTVFFLGVFFLKQNLHYVAFVVRILIKYVFT